jgi:1-acyl-sn-glycerol-3-phosphate acyltransferase
LALPALQLQNVLNFLPPAILGSLTLSLIFLNTVFWSCFLFPVAFLKLILPLTAWQKFCAAVLIVIAQSWIDVNNAIFSLTQKIEWDVQGTDGLDKHGWYLVLSNHQSWLDVLVLQKVFNHKIPFLKFFLKKNLIWMPMLGQAWWAMDMPFMQRYSKEFLAKHPELKGQDLEATRKACEKFKLLPVSVINFVEGTRYTPEKHGQKQSPYRHLLPPKAGGIAFVLSAMGEQFQKILDVTIVYPEKHTNLWDMASGQVHKIVVSVRQLPLPQDLLTGDYTNDTAFQNRFQTWMNGLWSEKDTIFESLEKTH